MFRWADFADYDVVRFMKAGDRRAYQEFVLRTIHALYTVAFRHTLERQAAQQIVASYYVACWNNHVGLRVTRRTTMLAVVMKAFHPFARNALHQQDILHVNAVQEGDISSVHRPAAHLHAMTGVPLTERLLLGYLQDGWKPRHIAMMLALEEDAFEGRHRKAKLYLEQMGLPEDATCAIDLPDEDWVHSQFALDGLPPHTAYRLWRYWKWIRAVWGLPVFRYWLMGAMVIVAIIAGALKRA